MTEHARILLESHFANRRMPNKGSDRGFNQELPPAHHRTSGLTNVTSSTYCTKEK